MLANMFAGQIPHQRAPGRRRNWIPKRLNKTSLCKASRVTPAVTWKFQQHPFEPSTNGSLERLLPPRITRFCSAMFVPFGHLHPGQSNHGSIGRSIATHRTPTGTVPPHGRAMGIRLGSAARGLLGLRMPFRFAFFPFHWQEQVTCFNRLFHVRLLMVKVWFCYFQTFEACLDHIYILNRASHPPQNTAAGKKEQSLQWLLHSGDENRK